MENNMIKKIMCLILAVLMLLCACQGPNQLNSKGALVDGAGNAIDIPDEVNRIVSISPAVTETLIGLGAGDKIAGADVFSVLSPEMPEDIPRFDILYPDIEKLISLNPDVILITTMSMVEGEDPLRQLRDLGISVVYMKVSNTIEDILNDIKFLGDITHTEQRAAEIIAEMEKEISLIKETGAKITNKKTVYFEVGAEESLYTFGSGVYLNEIIELIGAQNIFAGQREWISVLEEEIIMANPDVIITNSEDVFGPVEAIKARHGWEVITAVKNDAVYSIDRQSSSNPSFNIMTAVRELSRAVYPEFYS